MLIICFAIVMCYIRYEFSSPKQPKNLDPSYKVDLDFQDCLAEKIPSYIHAGFGFE